jgi:hypothetical protein
MTDTAAAPELPPVKKVTRGSENRQRSKVIPIRMHPADAERLKADAADAGMSVSGYLASGRLGSEAAPRPRIRRRRTTADVAALLQACVEFSRADSLLNQIAHASNTLALFAEEQGAGRLLAEVRELRRAVERVGDKFDAPVAAIHAALGDDSQG